MSSRPPFDRCWDRVDRATAHREAAIAEWNTFISGDDPYDTWLDDEGDGKFTLWMGQVRPTPPDIGLLFGEWLYQLRAALDNAVYATAVFDTQQDPPPRKSSLQMPICETESLFNRHQYKIGPLSQKHRAWIERIQPYKAGDRFNLSALYWLNDLARIDRHRSIHVVGGYVAESNPIVDAPNAEAVLFEDIDRHVLIDPEAVIARFKVIPFAPDDNVKANPQAGIDPEFAEWVSQKDLTAPWRGFTFGERQRFIEANVAGVIGWLERDCIGKTRVPDEQLAEP